MDNLVKRKLNLTLAIIVVGSTIVGFAGMIFYTGRFPIELFLFSSLYVAYVLLRLYKIKLPLQGKTGALSLYLQLVAAVIICMWSESFIFQILVLVLIGEFTLYQSRIHSIFFTLISYISVLLAVLSYRHFPPLDKIYLILPRVMDFFTIFGMSLLARIAFQQKMQLAQDNDKLQIASIELQRKAELQERTRISREIHDSVGHTLTSALVGLQTATSAIEKEQYSLAKEMMEKTTSYIRIGLDEVRSSVHLLRDPHTNHQLVADLIKLIEETKNTTKVDIECDIDQTLPTLSPKIELVIYRALQEGMTNGIRHGSSTYFRFSLTGHSEYIRFVLTDNGRSVKPIVYGFGLNAMKERVREVGGELSASRKDAAGGLTIEITIPVPSN